MTFGNTTTTLATIARTALAPPAPTATLAPTPTVSIAPVARTTVAAPPVPSALGYTGPKPPEFSADLKAAIMADFQPYLDTLKPVDVQAQIAKLQAQLVTLPFGSTQRTTITAQINLLKTSPASAAIIAQTSNLALALRTGTLIPAWYKGPFVDVSQGATPQTGYLRYRILYRNGVKIWEVSHYFKLNEGNQTITDAMAAEGNGWHVKIGEEKTTYTYEKNAWGSVVEMPHRVVPLVDSYWFLGDPHPILKPGIVGAGYVPGISGRAITRQAAIGVASVVLPVVGGVVAAPLIFAGIGTAGAGAAAGAVAGAAATGAASGAGAAAGAVASATVGAGIGTAAGVVGAASVGAAIGGVTGSVATGAATGAGAAAGESVAISSNVASPAGIGEPIGTSAATPLTNPPPPPNVGGAVGNVAGQAASQSSSLLSNLTAQIGQIPSTLAKAALGSLVSKGLAKIIPSNKAEPIPHPQRAGFAEFFTTPEGGLSSNAWLLLIPLLLLIILFFTGRRLQG